MTLLTLHHEEMGGRIDESVDFFVVRVVVLLLDLGGVPFVSSLVVSFIMTLQPDGFRSNDLLSSSTTCCSSWGVSDFRLRPRQHDKSDIISKVKLIIIGDAGQLNPVVCIS
jgi:hypothetical protein